MQTGSCLNVEIGVEDRRQILWIEAVQCEAHNTDGLLVRNINAEQLRVRQAGQLIEQCSPQELFVLLNRGDLFFLDPIQRGF